jgi:hypothetical protein
MRILLTASLAVLLLSTGCTPVPAPPTVPAPTPATTSPASADPCGFLPPEVDRRACAPVAGDPPIPPAPDSDDLYVLAVDGPIRCDVMGDVDPWAACAAGFELTPAPPAEQCDAGDWDNNVAVLYVTVDEAWASGQGGCRNDPLISEVSDPPTLPLGDILVVGEIAVLATAQGVTVWNGEARRGFAILDGHVHTW